MKAPADQEASGHSGGVATTESVPRANPDQHDAAPPKPTPAPVNADAIPTQLRDRARWVAWRYEWDAKRGEWTKVPHRVDGRGMASSTNPDTWGTFEDALDAYQAGAWDGIGFVVGDGIAGGDVDDCRDPDTGELSEAARDIITTANTYAEVSPSGAGLRYFAFGTLPPKGRKRGPFEVYDGDGGRYLTVTGHHVEGTPDTLHERTDELATIHARYIAPQGRRERPRTQPRGVGVQHEDQHVLEAMWRSDNGPKIRRLWDGDMSDHVHRDTGEPDHSAADLALASHLAWWTNYSPDGQADRLFRASGLMRPKWDEKHYADGTTYGQHTLALAFEGKRPGDGYTGRTTPAPGTPTGDDDEPAADWPEPQPLPDEAPSAPQLEPEMLPGPLRRWAEDTAERASILVDSLVPGILVGLAVVVGNRWRIRPKQHDAWTVVPNLWGVLVHPPGQMKTYVLNSAMRPVRQIEGTILERYERERMRDEVDAEILKHEMDTKSDDLKKAVKKGDRDTIDALRDELARLKQEAAQTERRAPALLVNDATVERLLEEHRANPRGLGLVRDELYGWYMSLHKQGRETDRAFYLEAHDGDKSYRQDRIKRGTITAPIVTLSILGGIQPTRLRAIQQGALSGEDADGLLQRLQVMVWPDAMPPYQLVDREPDHELEQHVTTIYERLFDHDPARFGFEDGQPGVTRFDPDAQHLFYEWLERLEHRVRDPEVQATPAWASYLGKQRSLMPSLALLLHLVDLVTGEASDVRVGLTAARRAAALVEYLEGHAAKVYAPELAQREAAARRLAEKLAGGQITDGMRVRDIYAREWAGLAREQVEAGLALLESLGWLRVVRVPPNRSGGRPSVVVRLRPDILEVADGASQ